MKDYVFGMIGLGTMGRNLLLNMADHGYKVAGHDKDQSKIELLTKESSKENVKGFERLLRFKQWKLLRPFMKKDKGNTNNGGSKLKSLFHNFFHL